MSLQSFAASLGQVAEALQRTRNVLRARLDYLFFVYGTAARWFGAFVVSVVLLIGDLLPEPWSSAIFWAGVALAIFALGELLYNGVRSFLRWTAVDLEPRKLPFDWRGAQWTDTGRIVPISTGVSPELAWQSPEVDDLLRAKPAFISDPQGSLESDRFRLPDTLTEIGGRSLRHRSARRGDGSTRRLPPARFNGRLVRLAAEPTPRTLTSGELVFQHVRYYDGESSNEVWPLTYSHGARAGRSPVEPFVVDRERRLLSLDQARAGNILGISLFAVTRDDQIILVRQSPRNSVSPGAFASSSSGSADPEDFGWHLPSPQRERRALAGVMTGMLRELTEESRVRRDEVIDATATVTGYFRWLDRAAKPEFTGLVRLRVASEELSSRAFTGGESAFTVDLGFLPLAFAIAEASSWRADPSPPAKRQAAAVERFVADVQQRYPGATVSPSCVGAWCAAIDFLAARPEWLVESAAAR